MRQFILELLATINDLKPFVKALVAFFAGVLQVAALYFTLSGDGNLSAQDVTALINATLVALTGTGLVYALPNKKG